MQEADATRIRAPKQLEEELASARLRALELHEPMLVHLLEMVLLQIAEIEASEE